jgi:hypothetical protein
VQPFGTWHGTVQAAPKSIDVFDNGEPLSFNVHKYIAEVQPSRVDFHEWDCGVSDSAGWILMHSGRQLVPRSSLQSATVPILALTDALDAQDFICVARSVDHYPRQGKLYDGRKLHGETLLLTGSDGLCMVVGKRTETVFIDSPSVILFGNFEETW